MVQRLLGLKGMHFEVLVEDISTSATVDVVLEKMLGKNGVSHTWQMHSYKGLGRLPKGLSGRTDASKRILLDRLPQVLQGYGRSLGPESSVVVVVDLDDRDCRAFKRELLDVLNRRSPCPRTLFRIAIEEKRSVAAGRSCSCSGRLPQRTPESALQLRSGLHLRYLETARRRRPPRRFGAAQELAGGRQGEIRVGNEDCAAHERREQRLAELSRFPGRH